jgi:hypothetical protein
MSDITALHAAVGAGTALGVRHSFEPDHLAAVVNIVDEDDRGRSAYVGALWGAGHSVPVALSGAALLALGVRVPESVAGWFELLAGAVLVYLGARTLLDVVSFERHDHDGGEHAHLSLGPVAVGGTHSHYEGESFLVGIVHGLAGSGLVVVLVTPTVPTTAAAVGFLVSFALASVVAMGTLSYVWGALLGFEEYAPKARAVAGVVSVVVGVGMALAFFGVADTGVHSHDVGTDHGVAGDGHTHDHGDGTGHSDGHTHGGVSATPSPPTDGVTTAGVVP